MCEVCEFSRRDAGCKTDGAVVRRVHLQHDASVVRDGLLVVGAVRPISRSNLSQARAALNNDIRNPKRAADLDQLPARHEDLTASREGA